jgi:hypothetical protein
LSFTQIKLPFDIQYIIASVLLLCQQGEKTFLFNEIEKFPFSDAAGHASFSFLFIWEVSIDVLPHLGDKINNSDFIFFP